LTAWGAAGTLAPTEPRAEREADDRNLAAVRSRCGHSGTDLLRPSGRAEPAAPLITTLVDATGLVIYVLLARSILGI
jgi:hypothetical protein